MAKKNSALTAAIAERISAKRKEMKLTQEQAADLSGLSHPYYACVERGAKGLGADSIVKVCTALDVSPDYLLTGAMTHSELSSPVIKCKKPPRKKCSFVAEVKGKR